MLLIRLFRLGSGSRWRGALALMILVALLGVLGYMIIVPGMSFLPALYQTVITVSTVGYQDTALEEIRNLNLENPALRNRVMLFEIFLVIFGIGAVAYAFSVFVRSLVEGEIRDHIGLHRTKRRLFFMKNHYIICGYGRMGEIIAETMVKQKIPVVVIENNPMRRPEFQNKDLTYLTGDATKDELLEEAEIRKARGLIAVTSSDPDNLFVTLSARQLNPDLNIVSRALSPNVEKKLIRAGANRVILPYEIGAHQIAQAALRPNVVDFIEIATRTTDMDIEIEEITAASSSELAGKALKEATILRELGLIVIGIRFASDGKMHYHPSAETVIHPEDTLITLGKSGKLAELRSRLTS